MGGRCPKHGNSVRPDFPCVDCVAESYHVPDEPQPPPALTERARSFWAEHVPDSCECGQCQSGANHLAALLATVAAEAEARGRAQNCRERHDLDAIQRTSENAVSHGYGGHRVRVVNSADLNAFERAIEAAKAEARAAALEEAAAMVERGDPLEGHQAPGQPPHCDPGPMFALRDGIVERIRALKEKP